MEWMGKCALQLNLTTYNEVVDLNKRTLTIVCRIYFGKRDSQRILFWVKIFNFAIILICFYLYLFQGCYINLIYRVFQNILKKCSTNHFSKNLLISVFDLSFSCQDSLVSKLPKKVSFIFFSWKPLILEIWILSW